MRLRPNSSHFELPGEREARDELGNSNILLISASPHGMFALYELQPSSCIQDACGGGGSKANWDWAWSGCGVEGGKCSG